jgi:hypothetical protein
MIDQNYVEQIPEYVNIFNRIKKICNNDKFAELNKFIILQLICVIIGCICTGIAGYKVIYNEHMFVCTIFVINSIITYIVLCFMFNCSFIISTIATIYIILIVIIQLFYNNAYNIILAIASIVISIIFNILINIPCTRHYKYVIFITFIFPIGHVIMLCCATCHTAEILAIVMAYVTSYIGYIYSKDIEIKHMIHYIVFGNNKKY